MKPVLVSGIQPTGKLHLGNYLGVLKNFIELQNSGKYSCFFFIADYHSITTSFNANEKSEQIHDLGVNYLSAGLDLKKSVIFQQSTISAHTELAWILNTLTPMGELRRMTQFKEKSELNSQDTNSGLFTYPVLMAADIFLYNAQFVPVGDDQLQHLELARTLARKFNSRFGNTFFEPKPILTKVPRLMSLDDPTKKMSKSRPMGCLFLDDSSDVIRGKIKKAVTDSGHDVKFDPEAKPAISNLLLIYSSLSKMPIPKIEKQFEGKGYGEFKKELGEVVTDALLPFQKKKKEIMKKAGFVKKALDQGNVIANKLAEKKLREVKKKIGLLF